jgi:hypothetical protein
MPRVQITLDDDTKVLLEQMSAARGVALGALVTTLLRAAEHPSGNVVHGSEGIALDVVTHRLDQLQQDIAQVQAACEACAAELRETQQSAAQGDLELQHVKTGLAYCVEQLEPMVGVALRPGVQYRSEAAPKRGWWQWGTS